MNLIMKLMHYAVKARKFSLHTCIFHCCYAVQLLTKQGGVLKVAILKTQVFWGVPCQKMSNS